MTDHEAAQTLYSVCGYLGLSPEMLKYRVLSGWVLMQPPAVEAPCWPTPDFGKHPERMRGETKPRLLTEDY